MSPLTIGFFIDSVVFTPGVVSGAESLGGSESACLGLARALKARGHRVYIFATKLDPAAAKTDHAGVEWHPLEHVAVLNQYIEWDVFVSLRMPGFFAGHSVNARLKLLWSQDLMTGEDMKAQTMAAAWQVDHYVYVSEFHRRQWEANAPELAPRGYASRNGFDPALVPADVTKKPNQIIHISRPERGLKPLLAIWPKIRAAHPHAELVLCRYSSMYDPGGWGEICKHYDRQVDAVNQQTGGLTFLGELGKPALYQALAESAVMLYPGVATFAETSCIAAIEAQACGTPFVGSYKGALPETAAPAYRHGHLLRGDAERDDTYHAAAVAAVVALLDGCARQSKDYRRLQLEGRTHVARYAYDVIAAEWETQIETWFSERYEANRIRVMRQLLHEDDHVAAKAVAEDIVESTGHCCVDGVLEAPTNSPELFEAVGAVKFCDYVIAGKDHTAENYAAHAADPLMEAEYSERFKAVVPMFKDCTRVLDVACGNGSFALKLAKTHPTIRVVGLDYAEGNIAVARAAAEQLGLADRCTFIALPVYDFDTQGLTDAWQAFARENQAAYDGLFVGEFIEHCAGYQAVIDGLEVALQPDALAIYTCPNGPMVEIIGRHVPIHRGHVHRFASDDVEAVWGPKSDWNAAYVSAGYTVRGKPLGNWIISYRHEPGRPAGQRPLEARIARTRPQQRLSVMLIVKDAEQDLARCLDSVWSIAHEIIVGDTGSTDHTKAIARDYGATVLDLAPVEEQAEGFAGARNAVLAAATGDWVLWIDADEMVVGAEHVSKYTETGVFQGYVLHQTHLYMDMAPSYDIPVRLFRREPQIRFFGCVHEQPGNGDANTDLFPVLEVMHELAIAHTGYLTELTRRQKMLHRNLPLLVKDRQVFKERTLGIVLVIRDYVNLADHDREQHGGRVDGRAVGWYQQAIALFEQHFADPAHKFHQIARPYYETAIRTLGRAYEIQIALGGRYGGMENRRATVESIWVQNSAEIRRMLLHKLDSIETKMHPLPLHVDPFEDLVPVTQPVTTAEPMAEVSA